MEFIKCFILILLINFTFCDQINYNGYNVFRVKAFNKNDVSKIQKLEAKYDFWHSGNLKGEADIMTSSKETPALENYFKENNLNYSLLIKDVGKLIQEEKITNEKFSNGRMNWNSYQNFSMIESWLLDINNMYPNIVTLYTAGGGSHLGNELYIVKLSKNNGREKQGVWIDSALHGREWVSPAIVTYIINEFVTKQDYEEYSHVLDNLDLFIMPIQNPDGFIYTHTDDRLWRKSRQIHDPEGICVGTDGNRNFPFQWGGEGADPDPCSDSFRGPHTVSEPEVAAVINAIEFFQSEGANMRVYMTIHSYGQYIVSPWGYTDREFPPNNREQIYVAGLARDAIQSLYGREYTIGPAGATLFPISGTSQDWAYNAGMDISYDFELRDTGENGFLLPAEEIIPCAEETWLGFFEIFQYIIVNQK